MSSGDRRWAAPALAAPDLAVPCAHAPCSSPAPRPPALAHLYQSLLSQDGLQALPCHPDQADSGKASRTKGRPQAQPALSSSSSRLKGLEERASLSEHLAPPYLKKMGCWTFRTKKKWLLNNNS